MGRNSPADVDDNPSSGTYGLIRDRFPVKRNPGHYHDADHFRDYQGRSSRGRSGKSRFNRKGLLCLFPRLPGPFRGRSLFYGAILFAVFVFALASMVLQSSITSVFGRQGSERGRMLKEGLKFGSTLRFATPLQQLLEGGGLDRARLERRIGVRPPRIALILGNMKMDPQSLMLFTVVKNLHKLGYTFKIYAIEAGPTRSTWETIGSHISILDPEQYGHIDWSIYEGVLANSVELKEAIASLMQEPFCSLPFVWIIQEDILANRLTFYKEMGWNHLISQWRTAFSRANMILFSDFTMPMLYSVLDTGNFFVIPGSPVDVWSAEKYLENHLKYSLRDQYGIHEDDLVVLVIGSSFFYDGLSWDYAVTMHTIGSLLTKYARRNDAGRSFKFIFLCGNSTDGHDQALQEITSHLGLIPGSIRHFGMNADVNGALIMADIVLYGSSQDEQGFPPLLVRAMSFGIPLAVPDIPVITKYIIDGVHGIIFPKISPDALTNAFSLLISDGRLSHLALAVASSGKLLAKDMLTSECVTTYAKLLENILDFPSDVILPSSVSQLQKLSWEWNFMANEMENQEMNDMSQIDHENIPSQKYSVVYNMEEFGEHPRTTAQNDTEILLQNFPNEDDWEVLQEIEKSEESEEVEMKELEERMEKDPGEWNDIYRNARKSEKLNFESNERDEGELERTGQPVCIYEIYGGPGAWPFLHHGSLYRGLSLSKRGRRLRSDDVDAVSRLPLLNDSYYRDLLCEMGGMFAVANKIDNIHKRPWIGFQSWRAAGRKLSLTTAAEKVLEQMIQEKPKGDVIYFWAHLDMGGGVSGMEDALTFWSRCDILNGGGCRNAFEQAFRKMYSLPPQIEALPPMPEDGGHWSTLNSWVMPTPSFLEFMMFTRIFTDSLDSLHSNISTSSFCLLGSTEVEKRHCYCRILELLVNVWAYHSARNMIYMDPQTGSLSEQHPIQLRRGFMWAKYLNFTLLKSMDEDLAEAADDGDYPSDFWLWPSTGEVHWQGVYEREREERYRLKMDKKRKTREKLYERMKFGYKQKSLGR
ncbi:hypothetical protein SAY87_007824 [Trapa incisa]|uniref:Glycosyl transferase family 1 domain-containing protein n=1 Tax=Trapa incisa TaxID=236973 RepID=A0AAN7KH68_9MYRT|nr:hypothetical protein SAY87_007824 [Trapa incisa]